MLDRSRFIFGSTTMTGQSRSGTIIGIGDPPITDSHGNLWTINVLGQVSVNGDADHTTANVVKLGIENGQIWQENHAGLWWGKTVPSDTWFPPEGTATSPFDDATPMDPRIALLLQNVSTLTMQVSQAFGIIMSGIRRIPADIVQSTTLLTKEISTMSATLSGQVDAATAAISAMLDRLTTDVGMIGADVTTLESELATAVAGLPVGTTITQAQVDALTAASTRAGNIATSLEAIVATTVPPVATPAPTPVPTPEPTPVPAGP
jgi:hypothetical protein